MENERSYTSFQGERLLASGDLPAMLRTTKEHVDRHGEDGLVIIADSSGRQVDFDFRGSPDEVVDRAAPPAAPRGPGRPRLGVVSREVSLLPRHWEWLALQRGGASATLRRLVDEARRNETPEQRARRAAATAGRALTVLAGNRPNYEEAYRSLDAGERQRFEELTGEWPADIRSYLLRLAAPAFEGH